MSLIFVAGKDISSPKAKDSSLGEGVRYTSIADPSEFIDLYETKTSVSLDTLALSNESRLYTPISTRGTAPSGSHILFIVTVETKDTDEARDEFHRCCEEEHVPLLSKVPGFFRARRYKLESFAGTSTKPHGYIAIYEVESPAFMKEQGLLDSVSTAWYQKVSEEVVVDKSKGLWALQN
ncbi:hypothetical protein DL96DRAFT_247749 [Flagelloscypha sp. PMI_526]|nr:hypothetical protein DL96DRAFT_247749 [Flagelloscypha sp. PMI_526]